MRLYLDLCCFNRPYDDQSQTRIRLETEAMVSGIGEYDALHVASAIVGKADFLVTMDDKFIKRLRQFGKINAFFPVEAVALLEDWYED